MGLYHREIVNTEARILWLVNNIRIIIYDETVNAIKAEKKHVLITRIENMTQVMKSFASSMWKSDSKEP